MSKKEAADAAAPRTRVPAKTAAARAAAPKATPAAAAPEASNDEARPVLEMDGTERNALLTSLRAQTSAKKGDAGAPRRGAASPGLLQARQRQGQGRAALVPEGEGRQEPELDAPVQGEGDPRLHYGVRLHGRHVHQVQDLSDQWTGGARYDGGGSGRDP